MPGSEAQIINVEDLLVKHDAALLEDGEVLDLVLESDLPA